jgi:hypothetical protein
MDSVVQVAPFQTASKSKSPEESGEFSNSRSSDPTAMQNVADVQETPLIRPVVQGSKDVQEAGGPIRGNADHSLPFQVAPSVMQNRDDTQEISPNTPGVVVGRMVHSPRVAYVYMSDVLNALVPPGLVTVTLTVPVPPGEIAVMTFADLTLTRMALADPNLTAVAPAKLLPVTVTDVPPWTRPSLACTSVTTG